MKRLIILFAFLLAAASASALQQQRYISLQRLVVDDGAGNNAFGAQPTYRYSGLAFAPVATPTDVIQIQGSASATIRITRIRLTGVATGQGNMPVQIVRRSTAGTAGSAVLTAVTATKLDTMDPAPTAVVSTVGTANFTTLGTLVGAALGADRINLAAAGSGASEPALEFDFRAAPLRLRGASDWIAINLNGAAVPAGGVVDWTVETTEDNS